MKKFLLTEIDKLPNRQWATHGDVNVGYSDSRGHDPSVEAIGGYYGIFWYEIFRDNKGDLYKVPCYDGVNRSKTPYEGDCKRVQSSKTYCANSPLKISLADLYNFKKRSKNAQ